ncbi:DnaK suppressor protein [Actinomycetota bacterium]|nr:DnaK suppressor protein [Actinomycetota bacterium]
MPTTPPQDPRALLEELRGVTLGRRAALRGDLHEIVDASRGTVHDDEHDPEGATIAFERAQVDALARAAGDRLTEVDEALDRVRAGTYGRCEACGRDIDPARLAVRPTATRCVSCAR